jgi:hypothetical protein
VLADTPVAYWRFSETSGNVAHDETGNGHALLVGDGATWRAKGALAGDDDGAIRLDGTSILTAGPDVDVSQSGAFSLEAWLSPETASGSLRYLFRAEDFPADGPRDGMGIYYVDSQGLVFFRFSLAGGAQAAAATPALGTYAYVVATYDGGTLDLYVDGTHADSRPDPGVRAGRAAMLLGQFLVGAIDEAAINAHAQPRERIGAHFDAARGR